MKKAEYEYQVQGNYGYGHGYEEVYATDDRQDARDRLKEYRENEAGVPFRVRRVKVEGQA